MTLEEKRNHNIRLFPIYKMFAWDLLFYYAISFLFLTEVKGFNSAEVVLIDVSLYTLFKSFAQLPSTIVIDKIGKRNNLIIGNVFICASILVILVCPNIYWFGIADFFMAIGYVMKSLSESNILYDSLPHSDERRKYFSKLDGQGTAFYYYLNAFSTLITGFLYHVNPYLPVCLCLLVSIFVTYLSSRFYSLSEASRLERKSSNTHFKDYFLQLRYIFRHILKSSRLRCLIIFYALFHSLIYTTATLDRSLLADLKVLPAYLGIIHAALSILSGLASYSPNFIHRQFKNRVLTVFSILFIGSCLVSGLLVIWNVPYLIAIVFILLSFAIRAIVKGPFYTLFKRYLNSFSTSTVRTKIYSATYLFENLCGALIAFGVSRLLTFCSTAVVFTILGCLYTIAFVFLLHYMKSHVGLKPEEYKKEDIDLIDVH